MSWHGLAADDPFRDEKQWLAGIFEDWAALSEGMSRGQLEQRFFQSGDAFRHGRYVHRECDLVELAVELVPFDGPRYDGHDRLLNVPDGRDRVWRLGRPTLTLFGVGCDPQTNHQNWLLSLIEDCASIRQETSIQTVWDRFDIRGGPHNPGRVVACHRDGLYVQFDIVYCGDGAICEVSRPYLNRPHFGA